MTILLRKNRFRSIRPGIAPPPPPPPPTTGIHVAKNGSDTFGDGTSANPYFTFNKGRSVMSPGITPLNTIILHGGLWDEDIIGLPNGTNLTDGATRVVGNPGDTVLLAKGRGIGLAVDPTHPVFNIIIDSLQTNQIGIAPGGDAGLWSRTNSVYMSNAHDIIVQNCIFTGGGAGGGMCIMTHNLGIVKNIQFLNNDISFPNPERFNNNNTASHCVYVSSGHTSDAFNTAVGKDLNILVRGNNIYGANDRSNAFGVHVYGYPEPDQLNGVIVDANRIHNCSNGVIVGWGVSFPHLIMNNLIYDNTFRGCELDSCSGPRVYNNTIDVTQGGVDIGPIGLVTLAKIDNNNLTNCSAYATQLEATDPSSNVDLKNNNNFGSSGFLNSNAAARQTASGNLNIAPNYADRVNFVPGAAGLQNSGLTLAEVIRDFAGNARVNGSYSIGAQEY